MNTIKNNMVTSSNILETIFKNYRGFTGYKNLCDILNSPYNRVSDYCKDNNINYITFITSIRNFLILSDFKTTKVSEAVKILKQLTTTSQ